ncbi:DUF2513 domain-containing protein [Acidaminococcus timonensis]|uniref:DUF2513 domain-containing protein n=1 Tax=Acidaminococcus TaxID=904 RepID=UPI002592CC8B|nr:DUF2513 domain-containing protein [Acidaminococcus timonensis]
MKRNLDLIRNILLRIETNEKNTTLSSSDFADLEPDQNIVDYHLYLLEDAGYIDAHEVNTIGHYYPQYLVKWLTNDGCDYVDSIRSASIWEKTKEKLASVGGQASLSIVKTIAEHVTMSFLGI